MRVHTYTAGESGLLVNSYLVESDNGVVLVDANLLVSDAKALAARIVALHKPLLAAFVTHPHPDHYNGLPYVAPADVPVYSTAAVAATITDSVVAKRAQWQPVFGNEWPTDHRVPDHAVAHGDTVEIDGIGYTVHDLGPAESHADSYLLVGADSGPRVAFVGDLVFAGVHSYMTDGHTADWIDTLDKVAVDLDGVMLYPGHGSPGTTALLDDQRRYLLMYRETVRRLADGATSLTDDQKRQLTETMSRFLPGAALTWLVALGADPVAAELATA